MKLVSRLLLFAATTGYQIRVFADAARRLGMDLTLATDRCHVLEDPWGDRALPVKFDRIAESVDTLRGLRFDGVAAVGDRPAVLAAEAAAALGVPFHPPAAARACHDKYPARQLYQAAGMLVPWFTRAALDGNPQVLARAVPYPCVLKPLGLSASRGVIRANDEAEFAAAFRRIEKLGERQLQVESYIPGREFAVEGLVTAGAFRPIAIFDKPDPLEGPFFEETIYVTPSRQPRRACSGRSSRRWHKPPARLACATARCMPSCATTRKELGCSKPPPALSAACAPRRCVSMAAYRYEELILRHAVGEDVAGAKLDGPASGVMMIPIPKAGIYESVDGVDEASAVPGIEEVIVTAQPGQELIPLPEGASYLGFIFARGESPAEVEAALRHSHARLGFRIATALTTFRP